MVPARIRIAFSIFMCVRDWFAEFIQIFRLMFAPPLPSRFRSKGYKARCDDGPATGCAETRKRELRRGATDSLRRMRLLPFPSQGRVQLPPERRGQWERRGPWSLNRILWEGERNVKRPTHAAMFRNESAALVRGAKRSPLN